MALAVTGAAGQIPGNWLGAGHLRLLVNGSASPVSLDFGTLMPGRWSVVEEVVTADMAGVPAASLGLTVTAPAGSALAARQHLQVSYSDPLPAADLGWDGTRCAPGTAFAHTANASGAALGTLTPGTGVCVRFALTLTTAAGDEVQDARAAYTVTYTLLQSAPGASRAGGPTP
ncbi:MAG: hypothetical protein EPN43_10330 [Jatrophihabitans sp.]|nr:MAG: hypothetical protein EPN43_10330 [Jatrophihabitans sp.]